MSHLGGDEDKEGWVDPDGKKENTTPNVYLPTITRPISAMHSERGRDKAGYSDKILIDGPERGRNRLIIEDKTFWSFDNQGMIRLISGTTATPKTGIFDWDNKETEAYVLQQVSD